jgi:ATP-dependent protease ClpP protease subunit
MASAPVAATTPRPLFIWFSAPVDQTSTDTLMNAIVNFYTQGIRDVHLLISTSGGGIMNGMTLFNFLRGLPINLTTHNVGNVDSIGNVIFLAGQRRFACAHSTFMFHGVAWNTVAAASLGEQSLSELLANVKSDQRRIANLIVERTQLQEEAVNSMFARAETKSAEEALACSLIHEIRDVQIPADAVVASLTAPGAPQNARC